MILDYTYTDEDSHPESGTEIRWYRNSTLQTEHNNMLEITANHLFEGDEWYVTVRPKDNALFGPINTSSTITIKNTPPVIVSLDIIPSSAPTTLDNLFVNWLSSDSDNDILQYSITWYLNGEVNSSWSTSATNATLYAGNTSKYQEWYFTLQAYDGENYSTTISPATNITIVNSKPIVLNANFTNIEPTNDTDIIITYSYYDADGDSENKSELVVIWYKDWVIQPQYDDYTRINSTETNNGEVWTYLIRVSDNDSLLSDLIPSITGASIGGGFTNNLPNAVDLTLSPLTPTTANILTAGYTFSDLDIGIGQTERDYNISWYMDGVFQSEFSINDSITIPSSATSKGQEWYFTVKVFDGLEWGPINTSLTITILNSIPRITSGSFEESDVKTLDNLTY